MAGPDRRGRSGCRSSATPHTRSCYRRGHCRSSNNASPAWAAPAENRLGTKQRSSRPAQLATSARERGKTILRRTTSKAPLRGLQRAKCITRLALDFVVSEAALRLDCCRSWVYKLRRLHVRSGETHLHNVPAVQPFPRRFTRGLGCGRQCLRGRRTGLLHSRQVQRMYGEEQRGWEEAEAEMCFHDVCLKWFGFCTKAARLTPWFRAARY